MTPLKTLAAFGCILLLSGCAYFNSIQTVRQLEATSVVGNSFNAHLAKEYRDLAAFEQFEMFDYRSAQLYAAKGLAAAAGESMSPFNVEDFKMGAQYIDVLNTQRARLVRVLDSNARSTQPQLAARAQAKFDCWVEQQEEDIQPPHIESCRDEFMAIMAQLDARPAPRAEVPPRPAPVTHDWVVHFDFDKDVIRADAASKLDEVAAAFKKGTSPRLKLSGHADTAGPAVYNKDLSMRRAKAVKDALVARGISADAIVSLYGAGEEKLAVETADGVPNQQNRRVIITLHDQK